MKQINTLKMEWDLTSLLHDDADPFIEKEREILIERANAFILNWKSRTDYTNDPKILGSALQEYNTWIERFGAGGSQGYYFHLREAQESSNPQLKAINNKIDEFSIQIINSMQFFEFAIAKIDKEKQSLFLKEKSLLPYRHFLEQLFASAKYLLTEPEEKILNLKAATSSWNWVQMTASNLAKRERMTLLENGNYEKRTYEGLMTLMNCQKKEVRDEAAKNFNSILREFIEMAEAEINSILADKKVNDSLRNISRPDLIRHISDDIDTSVVDALITAVTNRFDISERFYLLKAKLLGQKNLSYHERNVEIGSIDKDYSFDEAATIIYNAFLSLDHEFAAIFKSFVENGQMDVFPRVGKMGGAFCSANLISQPTFIMLNFTGKLRDLMTIAHEAGHGINNEYIRKSQIAINFATPMATAEVASTFMEDFVFDEIIHEADEELQLAVLMQKLNDFISTIQRQVACYNFETALHLAFREEGYLSYEKIGAIFQKNMSAYMGKSVLLDEGSENWWIYWGHIRSFFYVYSYASGLLISKSMQNSVRKDKAFIEQVKIFLSAGTSESPKNIFLKMGIDITDVSFWNKGLDEIDVLLIYTEKLAEKLHKI